MWNIQDLFGGWRPIYRPLGYERVYLQFHKVADTPFHIQGDDMSASIQVGPIINIIVSW